MIYNRFISPHICWLNVYQPLTLTGWFVSSPHQVRQTARQTWSRRRRRLHIYNCSSQHSSAAESDYVLLCALFVVKGRGCKTTPSNLLSDVIKWLKTRENAVVWDVRALFKMFTKREGFPKWVYDKNLSWGAYYLFLLLLKNTPLVDERPGHTK